MRSAWFSRCVIVFAAFVASGCSLAGVAAVAEAPYLVVLGVAQDGGIPQAGSRDHPAWRDPALRRRVVSLALVDPATTQRWLFEATPDIREQLHLLDTIAPVRAAPPGLSGIFLTHAHIGHYTGLVQLGHEAMGARAVPVHVMPRFLDYLRRNGPWDQLVRYRNIELMKLQAGRAVQINDRLSVTPLEVPHRQEYSEVVAFRIDGPKRSALFLPDIDSWQEWEALGTRIEDVIAEVDIAWVDATFYADGEIPGRDMSGFPHPFVVTSLARFASLPAGERAKIHFIHFNHTNPAARPGSSERRAIEAQGFHVAERGQRFDL